MEIPVLSGSLPATTAEQNLKVHPRISSIDLLRGIIMVIMALDHVRDYFHADTMKFEPTDLEHTNVFLFFTRWITHFCAPVFVLLTGTAAFLSGRKKTKKEHSLFLLKRGLWLILLEITIINFGWSFNIYFPFTGLQVIWAIGISMLFMAIFINLPIKWIAVIGLILVAAHNILDSIHFDGFLWAVLHEQKLFQLDAQHLLRVAYPVIPWIGLMAIGYCLGTLYAANFDAKRRKKNLALIGSSAIILFVLLRFINNYGDMQHWSLQHSTTFSILSFLNTSKYPPSLLYILMTIGPALLFLAFMEKKSNLFEKALIHFGRVPMFYYILHLYLLHLLAMIAAQLTGFGWQSMILIRRTWIDPQLKGYGFSLLTTYGIWLLVIVLLYPLCKWYDGYKTRHKEKWWLSYL